eukprot:6476253-Amphidinium_carterae.1
MESNTVSKGVDEARVVQLIRELTPPRQVAHAGQQMYGGSGNAVQAARQELQDEEDQKCLAIG